MRTSPSRLAQCTVNIVGPCSLTPTRWRLDVGGTSGKYDSIRYDPAMMHNVAVLVPERVSVFELSVPGEVFGIDRSDLVEPWYGFRTVAASEPPLVTSAGFTIDTPWRLADLPWADTVIVPAWTPAPDGTPERGSGWRKSSTTPPQSDIPAPVIDAVRAAHDRGARIVGICTGAFVVAAAGLLDGKRATTHWLYAKTFATRFPKVTVDPDVLYIDEGQVLTSAGTTAGIDLCLHLVRLDHGASVANAVARRMVCPPHRDGGQAQYIDRSLPEPPEGDPVSELLVWVLDHLDDTLTVEQMADRCAMSPRTFARRFRDATGTTPHRWLTQQRVARAQELLETTDLNVDVIADRCGLGSAANLRKHLRRIAGTTPSSYRRVFNPA